MTQQGSPAPEISPEIMAAVAAAMAAQRPAEPPAPNGYRLGGRPAPNVIDLDEQLANIPTDPQPVKFGGHTYMVKRDFTTEQANQLVLGAAEADASTEASVAWWTHLVGAEDAPRLVEMVDQLPMLKANAVAAQFGAAAGLGAALQGNLGEA